MQDKRELFIDALAGSLEAAGIEAAVIFDSSHAESGLFPSSSHIYPHIDVIFSPAGLTADEYILEYLEAHTNAKGLTLVTDDRHLALLAKDYGVKHIKIEEFLKRLSRRKQKRAHPVSDGKPAGESSREFTRLLHIFEKKFKDDDHS